MGRLAASRLSEAFGQQFVVENRVGGNGVIAAEAVARAAPDGYTLLWAPTSVVAICPAITKTAYDPVKDFVPISLFSVAPQVLIVNPKVPANTVPEFMAYVKSQKEKVVYAGGGGPGSSSNLIMSIFLKRAGIEMMNVSYRGTAPALTDVIAGHIPTMFIPISEALPQARAGSIRMLAVSSGTRSREAPDVPTLAEQGFPGFHMVSWTGLMAPAGTPQDIIDRIAAEFARALKDASFVENIQKAGAEPAADASPAEFSAFIAKEMALWGEAVKTAGVTLQ
jgi:tripartite-type tricarboxylate transporter receptor subunit TctC